MRKLVQLMLYIVLILADHLIGKNPGRDDGKYEKSNYN